MTIVDSLLFLDIMKVLLYQESPSKAGFFQSILKMKINNSNIINDNTVTLKSHL